MKITLEDIAKAANVSKSTVSKVLTNTDRISEATRERVLKIMKEMNYQPNMIARSLSKKSTNNIGVVFPNRSSGMFRESMEFPIFQEMLSGITNAAYSNKYNVMLSSFGQFGNEEGVVRELVLGGMVDGIIYISPRVEDIFIPQIKSTNIPFVCIGRVNKDNEVNYVDNDQFLMGYKLTERFIKDGHKNIAFLGESKRALFRADRANGYRKALEDNGRLINEKLILNIDTLLNKADITEIWNKESMPDAMVVVEDIYAIKIIKQLENIGLSVPKDVAVAGFSNIPVAEYFNPALTSVDFNAFKLGLRACEILIDSISNKNGEIVKEIIDSEIIIRKSSERYIFK
jgi:DNA-binding LacI/PurR family transcriptional regulator